MTMKSPILKKILQTMIIHMTIIKISQTKMNLYKILFRNKMKIQTVIL
jgi:hypothetical protein